MDGLVRDFLKTLSFEEIRAFIRKKTSEGKNILSRFIKFARETNNEIAIETFLKKIDAVSNEYDIYVSDHIINTIYFTIPFEIRNFLLLGYPHFIDNDYLFLIKHGKLIVYNKSFEFITIRNNDIPAFILALKRFQEGIENSV
jgi:hypothetical protein